MSTKPLPAESTQVRQEIVEVVKYVTLNIPEIDLAPIEGVKAIDGKLKVLTPERLKGLYETSITSATPIVVWAADEDYMRELENWFRNNSRYTKELLLHRAYLLNIITTLKEESENTISIPDDP